jgi:hypothetical protein
MLRAEVADQEQGAAFLEPQCMGRHPRWVKSMQKLRRKNGGVIFNQIGSFVSTQQFMGAWGLHGVDEVHVDLMHVIVPGAQNGTVLKNATVTPQ